MPVEYEPTAEKIVCRYADGVRLVLDFKANCRGNESLTFPRILAIFSTTFAPEALPAPTPK